LFAGMKMRLMLAARRCGVGAEPAVEVLLGAMGMPEDVWGAAWAVRRRRDRVGEARRVLRWFEGVSKAGSETGHR